MEQICGKRKASMHSPEDFISNIPDNVVTNILNRLPLQNAVGTSALSRNWRFKWNMLSQLVFDEKFFAYLSRTNHENYHVRIISRILLHLRGGISKFVLSIDAQVLDDGDIIHWILFLSKKGIKDLTLENRGRNLILLPTHLFSCLELKHLELHNCRFHPPSSFHGFPYLLSLNLCNVRFESSDEEFKFLSHCPLLESLNLSYVHLLGKVKPIDFAKLENLKILSLSLLDFESELCDFEPMLSSSVVSTIVEIIGSLPILQELQLEFFDCEVTEDDATKRFPTTFPHLKTLKLSIIDLDDDILLSCAFELIRSCPNLHTLKIRPTKDWNIDPVPAVCSPEVDYNTMGPLQLQNIVFTFCNNNSGNDVTLIKYLLACSPFLKKFVIHFHNLLEPDEKLMFARTVLKLQRAYPAVDIDLC